MRSGIAYFGGSFDPIHMGHISCAETVLDAVGASSARFLPACNPWQKSCAADFDFRCRLIREAIKFDSRFSVDESERGDGPTYTIDTLKRLRSETDEPLLFVIGADQWCNLHTWKQWKELLNYANLAVCARNGRWFAGSTEVELMAQGRWTSPDSIMKIPEGRITKISMAAHPANSTQIRSWLANFDHLSKKEHEVLASWLPPGILECIIQSGKYGFAGRGFE